MGCPRERRGGNPVSVRPGDCAEQFISARLFGFKGQLTVARYLMVRPIEGRRADMNGLPRLIDRLFRGKQDGRFSSSRILLCLLSLADRCVHDIAQIAGSGEPRQETELRACCAKGLIGPA